MNYSDIIYNFFFDLEAPTCIVAGSKIHLYSDKKRWAIVFETNGYFYNADYCGITLTYLGNCIDYDISKSGDHTYISNLVTLDLISREENKRIRNKEGDEMEQLDLISAKAHTVNVHGQNIEIIHDVTKYKELGIHISEVDNPRMLISYGDLIRYINETNPNILFATKNEIRAHLPKDLPEILTIDKFHYTGIEKNLLPSAQELYQLIAKVLVTGDKDLYNPTQPPNSHWSNWESGDF